MRPTPHSPSEGDLYKTVQIAGYTFHLRYGYYEEKDRLDCPPVVIFPDLSDGRLRCSAGHPLVTQIQEPCLHYRPKAGQREDWCGDCIYYTGEHPEIGLCICNKQKQSILSGGI